MVNGNSLTGQKSLTRETASGLKWSFGFALATAALQVTYTATISRLLEPGDFGLLAGSLAALRFVTLFAQMGVGSAVIQRPSLNDLDVSTAMRLALFSGVLATSIVVLLSSQIASILRLAEVTFVMRWMSFTLLAGALTMIPQALLQRSMRFRALGFIQILSYCIGYLMVGIATALSGWGVWSLVSAALTQSACLLAFTFVVARPPIKVGFSMTSALSLLRFGGAVSVTRFADVLNGSIDTLAVGRLAGPASLGHYSRASLLVSLPAEQANSAATRVLFPSFSRVQQDATRFESAVGVAMGLLAFVIAIPIALTSGAASALVPWLLGSGWEDAIAVIPAIGIATGFNLLTTTVAVAAEARGANGRKLMIQIGSLATTLVFFGIAAQVGPTIEKLAFAWAAASLARHAYYWIWMFRYLGLSRPAIGRRYSFACVSALVVATPVAIVVRVWSADGFVAVSLSGLTGAGLLAALILSPIGSQFRRDVTTIRNRLR